MHMFASRTPHKTAANIIQTSGDFIILQSSRREYYRTTKYHRGPKNCNAYQGTSFTNTMSKKKLVTVVY